MMPADVAIPEPVEESIGLAFEGSLSKLTESDKQRMKYEIKVQIAEHLGISPDMIPDEAITLSEGSIIGMIDMGLLRKLNPHAAVTEERVLAARSAVARGAVSVEVHGVKQSAKVGDMSSLSATARAKATQALHENRAKPETVTKIRQAPVRIAAAAPAVYTPAPAQYAAAPYAVAPPPAMTPPREMASVGPASGFAQQCTPQMSPAMMSPQMAMSAIAPNMMLGGGGGGGGGSMMMSLKDQLLELKQLKDDGLIDEEEYQIARKSRLTGGTGILPLPAEQPTPRSHRSSPRRGDSRGSRGSPRDRYEDDDDDEDYRSDEEDEEERGSSRPRQSPKSSFAAAERKRDQLRMMLSSVDIKAIEDVIDEHTGTTDATSKDLRRQLIHRLDVRANSAPILFSWLRSYPN